MATRDRQRIDIVWLHLDALHPKVAQTVDAARSQHEGQGDFKLSVNTKADGTEALVKVAGVLGDWIVGKPWAAPILRVFTEADHDQAISLVTAPAWTGGL